ncbi:MAG: zinc dependent phospholipase C family protein [Desulfobacterales bacterium]|nr:MAG: zinc dependent phospholipase C family protein [Desulfobacterales bacterium]
MAKELTHILIAQDILKQMKGSGQQLLAEVIERNFSAYYLGSIIPDALFYDVPPFRLNTQKYIWLSRAFHTKRKAKNDQKAMSLFRSIAANPRVWQLKMAFAAGIITHTVIDRIFHQLIEYYTTSWGESGTAALATHREIETLIDMTLLGELDLCPRQVHLEHLIHLDERTQETLFRFYVAHLIEVDNAREAYFSNVLKKAYHQQRLFLRMFSTRLLYHITKFSNKIVAGRLWAWHILFYPEEVKPKNFPVLDKIRLNSLSDNSFFDRRLMAYKETASNEAIQHINVALKTFCQGK